MNRGHKMLPKRNHAESLGCHDRPPRPRIRLRELDNSATSIIFFHNEIFLYHVPKCLLVNNCSTPPGLPFPVAKKFRTQCNTTTDPQTDDAWHILWRQRQREAIATGFSRQPYATPEWQWIWNASAIYGITAFILNGLYRKMPVFLENNFLTLEHKGSFGFIPCPSSRLIYKNRPPGSGHITHRLPCQWSVAQQKDSCTGYL